MELNSSAPNSQSFDDVLQKLKQSMKAARSGGWIDSDSGSELEVALDHSPNGSHEGHPCGRGSLTRSSNQQHLLYIKDGTDRRRSDVEDKLPANLTFAQTSLWSNRKAINPRAPDISYFKSHPLTTTSLKYHSVDPICESHPQDSRISSLFDAPASPYVPRTPSTPASIATSAGSPYVRHHFKWEYLPPSTNGEGFHILGSQPRFVESSPPLLNINYDESDWSRGLLPKDSGFSSESAQAENHSGTRYNFETQAPSSTSTTLNGYRSVSYSPTHGKSQSGPPHSVTTGYDHRLPGLENGSRNPSFTKPGSIEAPPKPWLPGAPSQELKSHSQTPLNPASVSSVSFSLAPAAPIRLTAPEGDSQHKSIERKGIPHPPSSEIQASTHPLGSNCATTRASLLASQSAESLKNLSQQREKEVIRARLMGSSSFDRFQTKMQNLNKPFGNTPAPTDGDHSAQMSNLPSLFQQMRFPNTSYPSASSPPRVHPISESGPLRSFSASYSSNNSYCAPIFYISHPHGPKQSSFTVPSSETSSPNDLYQMAQLTPRTPVAPLGFSPNPNIHTTSPIMPYPQTSSVNKPPPFVPVIVPAVPAISGPAGAPLPGQVQPEEVRKSVKAQPPVVNTGNSGAMIPQPGDWMCICGFVNWRRRKVCMRCFPFADGNDSVGAMMALNAQRAALLAAGIPVTKDHSNPSSAISSSSSSLLQSSKTSSYPDMVRQPVNQKAEFTRTFSSPAPLANYGRLAEPTGIFSPRVLGTTMNPFDKPSPIGPIPGKKTRHSSDGETSERYPDGSSQQSLDREVGGDCLMNRPEKSNKVLRARVVAPGEELQTEGNNWEESASNSPRPRSFSMGAKRVWECNDEIRQTGVSQARVAHKSSHSDENPVGKEANGTPGLEEPLSSQAASSHLAPDTHQEFNTISNHGVSVNRQRTITSPTSSWQAIKALWQ